MSVVIPFPLIGPVNFFHICSPLTSRPCLVLSSQAAMHVCHAGGAGVILRASGPGGLGGGGAWVRHRLHPRHPFRSPRGPDSTVAGENSRASQGPPVRFRLCFILCFCCSGEKIQQSRLPAFWNKIETCRRLQSETEQGPEQEYIADFVFVFCVCCFFVICFCFCEKKNVKVDCHQSETRSKRTKGYNLKQNKAQTARAESTHKGVN